MNQAPKGKFVPVADKSFETRDDGQPVQFVDLLLEARLQMGTIALSFASAIKDNNGKHIAQVASRLRMELSTAQHLHKVLGDMLSDVQKMSDRSRQN